MGIYLPCTGAEVLKEAQIALDDLPRPGEPLTLKIHEDNQKLIDAEIAERAERVRAKLTARQVRDYNRRYKFLYNALNQAGYNALISERYQLYQHCVQLADAKKTARSSRSKKLQAEIMTAVERGLAIDEQLAPLYPLVDEFETIDQKLTSHNDVLTWEREDAENKAQFRREAIVWREQIKAVFRQSARLHHAGTDNKGRYFCKIPIIERVIFKEDRVLYQIKTTGQNIIERFFGRWHSALPYDVDIRDLTSQETLDNLSAGCNRVVTVERSESGTNLFYCISRLDAPDGIPARFLYGKVLDLYPGGDHAKTPWCAGVTSDRKLEWYTLEDLPHILIAGTTKSGKSNHVNQMIATWVSMNTPQELRLLLIDLKGGIEFTHWSGIRHELAPMVKHKDEVLPALRYLRSIMERRLERFEAIKAKNLSSFNELAAQKLPRIVCVVDEMATITGLGDLTSEIHTELRVLSSQGRAAGVHLVLCTQHPSYDVLPGWVKTNMSMRISGKMASHQASIIILDTITAVLIPNVRGRLVFSVGRSEIVAQSPLISDAEIASALRESWKYPEPDNSEFSLAQPVEVVVEKFSRRDVIEMALKKFDGKLSAGRIHEEVGNAVASERRIRHIIQDITGEDGEFVGTVLEHNFKQYELRKIRKAYVLVPVGQSDNNEDTGDTPENRPIERPIEMEPEAYELDGSSENRQSADVVGAEILP